MANSLPVETINNAGLTLPGESHLHADRPLFHMGLCESAKVEGLAAVGVCGLRKWFRNPLGEF